MSLYFFTASFVALGVATLFYLWYTWRGNREVGRLASLFAWMGSIMIGLSLLLRSIVSGRGPFSNMYEYSTAFAFGIALSYVVVEWRYKQRAMGFFVLPWVLLILASVVWLGFASAEVIEPLVPALQNNLLLTLHVSVAIVAYGIFGVSFGAAIMYLFQASPKPRSWMPTATTLDEISYRSVMIGFPFFALMIALGAYWADTAWGRYWGWDPKETASLVTWLIYAAYLHARNLRGWRGRPSAILLIVGFAATLFTYFGVNLLLPGLHSYAGV